MRTRRAVFSLRSVVRGLTSSTRRVWWSSFLIVTILAGLWGLANPPFSGPDEHVHVIRAHAIDHGELTGDEPSQRVVEKLREAGETKRMLVVRAPEIYQAATATLCFPFRPEVTASCLSFSGSTRNIDIPIYTARHPPAYYATVGVVSWFHRAGSGTVYLMRFIGAMITGAFVATAITALRRSAAPRLVAAALLLAFTPMVLFVSGIVNPSAPELAASLAFWVTGLVLVTGSHDGVDRRLVTAAGISGCVLALSRQLGPLWLGLIALTLLGMTNRRRLVDLARSNWARLWGGLIAVSALGQIAWVAIVKPLEVTPGPQQRDLDTPEILRTTFGASLGRVREMIGTFGWLDTPSPALTWVPWIAAVGFVFFLAVMWGRRRDVALLIGLLAATIVVPVLIESTQFETQGSPIWQGRYTLPIAFGIPLLAAFVLASTDWGRRLPTTRLLQAIGIVAVVGHVLAFAQNLRRYTVGYDGPVQFWKDPGWSPPVSPLLLTIGYVFVASIFVMWILSSVRVRAEDDGLTDDQRTEQLSETDAVVASAP
jgi:Predicted membrane protein (DUF2142)